jgi:hypothetical protein
VLGGANSNGTEANARCLRVPTNCGARRKIQSDGSMVASTSTANITGGLLTIIANTYFVAFQHACAHVVMESLIEAHKVDSSLDSSGKFFSINLHKYSNGGSCCISAPRGIGLGFLRDSAAASSVIFLSF